MMAGMTDTFVGRRIKRGAWLRDAEEVAATLAIAQQDQRGCPHAVRLVDALNEVEGLREVLRRSDDALDRAQLQRSVVAHVVSFLAVGDGASTDALDCDALIDQLCETYGYAPQIDGNYDLNGDYLGWTVQDPAGAHPPGSRRATLLEALQAALAAASQPKETPDEHD